MTTPTDANSILMGSGAPTAKFDSVGTVVTGTVVREPEARQQKDFRTQQPETWKDGSPKMMVVVQLATSLRDPERADDDGTRTLYIQGKNLTDAVRNAVRASGANGIHTGGTLTVQYVADGQAENGLNPPKLYAASYQPPAVSFGGVGGPAAAAAPVSPAPAYQPATLPNIPPAPIVPQQVQQPAPVPVQQQVAASVLGAPPNVDPTMWARLDPTQQAAVLAAMSQPAAAQQAAGF